MNNNINSASYTNLFLLFQLMADVLVDLSAVAVDDALPNIIVGKDYFRFSGKTKKNHKNKQN